jgi:hypothetical protein
MLSSRPRRPNGIFGENRHARSLASARTARASHAPCVGAPERREGDAPGATIDLSDRRGDIAGARRFPRTVTALRDCCVAGRPHLRCDGHACQGDRLARAWTSSAVPLPCHKGLETTTTDEHRRDAMDSGSGWVSEVRSVSSRNVLIPKLRTWSRLGAARRDHESSHSYR